MKLSQWRKNFKYLREKNFKNQTELGSILGASQQTITNWEKGIGAPKLEKFSQITKLFGISFEDLMESDIEKDGESQIEEKIKAQTRDLLTEERSEKGIPQSIRQSLLEKITHLEEIVQLQKENISSLVKRVSDKESIESMLTAENERLKSELKNNKQNQ